MTTLRPIADFQLAPPPTWGAIPAVPQEGDWPPAVADKLCNNEAAHQKLAIGLMSAHEDLIGPTSMSWSQSGSLTPAPERDKD